MTFILNILLFVVVLGVIVLIHELGHFYFAKKAKILCHEFSIGMGPAIYQKRKGETVYSIRSIPIGGFVSMAGEAVSDALIKKGDTVGLNLKNGLVEEIILDENAAYEIIGEVVDYDLYGIDKSDLYIVLNTNGYINKYKVSREAKYIFKNKREMWITPHEKSFESKTLLERFLVIFAGPLMNFILALVLYLIVGFFVLKPVMSSSEIKTVYDLYPAYNANMEAGDIITKINNYQINSWDDLSFALKNLNTIKLDIEYERNNVIYNDNANAVVLVQMAGLANISSTGEIYSDKALVGQVFGRAKSEGIKEGDLIISFEVDNVVYPIIDWDDILIFFRNHDSGEIKVNYSRDNKDNLQASYALISKKALSKLGEEAVVLQMGVSPTDKFDLGYSLLYPFKMIKNTTSQVLNTLSLLFNKKEKIGVGDLSGPIGIFSLVSQTRKQGFLAIVSFTAFLSINIGLLNLLPIPALDGGRLVFLGVEFITRKPLPRKLENTINNIMFLLLMALFLFVTYNDIIRLIKG